MTEPTMRTPLPTCSTIGPYRVPIRLVSPLFVARKTKTKLNEKVGFWDEDIRATAPGGCIYLDRTVSLPRQWEAYWHELGHAREDLHARQRGGL